MKIALRNSLAAFFRYLPYFKGKYKLGPALIPLLTRYEVEEDCLIAFPMRDGSIMRLDLRSFTEQKAFFSGEYDGGIIEMISNNLKPGSTVLDVGANIGFYSIALGQKLNRLSGSKLWAFEPIKSNFDRLVNLIEINNLENTVYPIQTALGNQEGEIQLFLDESTGATTGNAVWAKQVLPDQIKPNYSSPITKLDTFVNKHNITACDFIKVDIEGAELEFLQGGMNFITTTKPIIYAEFNPFWVNEFGYSFLDVAKLAKDWDYNLYKQVGRKSFTQIKELEIGISDMLMVPKEESFSTLNAWGILT